MDSAQQGVVPVSGVHAATFLLLAIWTGWLIFALTFLNESYGGMLAVLFAVAGLPLTLTGTVTWRLYLIIWLITHLMASAAVTVIERKPEQVLTGSVSLGGVVWLSVLHPASAGRYFIGILLMVATVAALVLFEYGWWRAFTGMIKWRVDAAVSQAYREADRRLDAANNEKRDAEQLLAAERDRHKEAEQKSQERISDLTARQRQLEAGLARARRALWQAKDNLPLVIDRIPGTGPQPQAATDEGDEVQVVVTTLELEPTAGTAQPTGPGGWSRGPGAPAPDTRMVVRRKVVTLASERGETAGHLMARAETRLREELSATAAESPAEKIGECILPAMQPWPAAAVEDGRKVLHNVVIGKPIQEISSGLGAPQPISKALGRIAAIAPVPPADAAFTAVKRVIQIGCIAWGALTLNPLVVAAGVKAIGHDMLVDALEKGIERTLLHRGPASGPQPPGPAGPADRTLPYPGTMRSPGLTPPTAGDPPSPGPYGTRRPARYSPPTPRRNNPGDGPSRGGRAPRV